MGKFTIVPRKTPGGVHVTLFLVVSKAQFKEEFEKAHPVIPYKDETPKKVKKKAVPERPKEEGHAAERTVTADLFHQSLLKRMLGLACVSRPLRVKVTVINNLMLSNCRYLNSLLNNSLIHRMQGC